MTRKTLLKYSDRKLLDRLMRLCTMRGVCWEKGEQRDNLEIEINTAAYIIE